MKNLSFYKKYYSLEKYLFEEVSNNFKKNHFLTNEEFFSIVIWKSPRVKTKVLKGIKKSGKTVKEITEKLFAEKDRGEKINILRKIYGIGIPVASAVLTVCFPDEFTITDYRATEALNKTKNVKIKDPSILIENYLEYVDICKEIAKENNLSLRDTDRCLWGLSFYEGESGLRELVEVLK